MEKEDIKILLVDDEEMIVNQLSHYLNSCGYNISGKSDPEEAREMLKSQDFDMVITDLKMPKVSGMEIVKLAKEIDRDILALIITGYADTDSAIEAIQHGVYDFMRKPFEFKKIKNIVDRAAERIVMKKENKALNRKIKKMLNYVTTIFDISSILYQVSDFDTIISMILDTITEGLKIKKAGILLSKNHSNNYQMYSAQNLPETFIENIDINEKSQINGKPLDKHEATIIDSIDQNLEIDGQQYSVDDQVSSCLFIPISFRESLFGYLLVFDVHTRTLSLDDELKLLKILATQIAPVFLTQNVSREKDQVSIRSVEYIIKNIIENSIKKTEQENHNVYFLQMKVIFKDDVSINDDYEIFQKKLEETIENQVPQSSEILWQGFGSIFIVLYESTPVKAEHFCANIRTLIEDLYTTAEGESILSMEYAMVAYPRDGKNFSEIMRCMEHKFYNSTSGLFTENQATMK
ncbi:MAG TPA: response regulator [bacterium]|nr:response regulator [bacterium]